MEVNEHIVCLEVEFLVDCKELSRVCQLPTALDQLWVQVAIASDFGRQIAHHTPPTSSGAEGIPQLKVFDTCC